MLAGIMFTGGTAWHPRGGWWHTVLPGGISMTHEELKQVVFDKAVELARKGAGWAQQATVLREVARLVQPRLGSDLAAQQVILTAWHDLFFERKLSWGYNLDN